VLGNPCTEGQVFHRWYREKEAKIEAKVECLLTYLISDIYGIPMREGAVLGD
jgi:hypothetical protein